MDTQSLETLIEDAQTGDTGSFEELHRQLIGPVFAFVAYRTSSRDDAKAVAEDSLAEVFLALPRFVYQSDAAFHAFVFTIARRQLAKYYAALKKHASEDVTKFLAETVSSDHETERSLRAALDSLDERSREIVILHHWSRYTFGEIATMLDMTEEAVRVRHHRAKATLKTIITR